jgi:predicted ester cyclase
MENVEVIRKVEEAWARLDLDALDQYFADGFQAHTPGSEMLPTGIVGAKMAHEQSRQAFPDRANTIHEIFGQGDLVVSRVSMSATNTGGLPWFGIPVNDKKIEDVGWITIFRLQGGKVEETWAQMEVPKLMTQLGAMPGPGGE